MSRKPKGGSLPPTSDKDEATAAEEPAPKSVIPRPRRRTAPRPTSGAPNSTRTVGKSGKVSSTLPLPPSQRAPLPRTNERKETAATKSPAPPSSRRGQAQTGGSDQPPPSVRPPLPSRPPSSTRSSDSRLPPPSKRAPRARLASSAPPPSSRRGQGDRFFDSDNHLEDMPTRRLQRTAESPQHADLSSSAPDAEADLAPPVIPSLQPKPAPSPRSSKPKKKTRARRGKSKRRTVTIPDDNVPVSLAPSAQMRDSNRGPASQPAGAKATGDLDMTPTAKLPDAKSSHHTAAVTILRIVSVTSSLPAVPSALPPDAQAKTPTSSRESLPMLEVEPASVPTIEELPPPPRRKRVATTPPDQTAAALAGKTIPEGSDELTSKRRLPPPRSIQPPPDGGPANGTATTPAPPTSPTPPAARKAAAPKKNKSPRAAAKPPTRQKRDWWQELYGEDMLRTLDNPRQKDVEKDVDFMLSSLELSAGSNILDLACGAGVHAVELASRGYQVVGIDLSPVMLKLARSYNDNRSQRVSFLESDMRQLSLEAVCDGIVCWSASFGYFDDETNEDVLRRMAKALRPGGRLLLDIPNRDYAAYNSPTMAWFEKRGAVCMDETRFDFKTSRLMAKRMVMFDDGRSRELAYDMRLYSLHEVQQLLKRTGFRVLEVSGHRAHRGAFFGAESDRIMLLAARVE